MTKKKETTKKELENEVASLATRIEELTEQLQQVSVGYQNMVTSNNAMHTLVMKYEETINLLTARLIESRTQS